MPRLESAVIYGLSAALIEEFAVKDGAVQATNFDSYPVMRMSDVPEIHTKIVATNNPPSGMGEIGVMTVAPAIANAVFQLTGKRLRHLPMTRGAGEEGARVSLKRRSKPAAFQTGARRVFYWLWN